MAYGVGATASQWRAHTRSVGAYVSPVRKLHKFFVPDSYGNGYGQWKLKSNPQGYAALEIGALNQKERPYAPSIANSCLRNCSLSPKK